MLASRCSGVCLIQAPFGEIAHRALDLRQHDIGKRDGHAIEQRYELDHEEDQPLSCRNAGKACRFGRSGHVTCLIPEEFARWACHACAETVHQLTGIPKLGEAIVPYSMKRQSAGATISCRLVCQQG